MTARDDGVLLAIERAPFLADVTGHDVSGARLGTRSGQLDNEKH